MSVTDPSMSNLMGGRLVAAPGHPAPPGSDIDIDTSIIHSIDGSTKRVLLVGFALNGLAAASGLNVPTEELVKKAVALGDAVLRELDRKKP